MNSISANITLPGFEPIERADSLTNSGGVGVYVANKFSAKILNKNELNSKCEDIWLQISDKNLQEIFTVGAIYRHPSTNVKSCIVAFNDKLSKLNPMHKYCMLGDININVDVMNSTQSTYSDANLNLLVSDRAIPLIDKLTRVSNTSSSIIDHIIIIVMTTVIPYIHILFVVVLLITFP